MTLDRSLWRRVEPILDRALELSGSERKGEGYFEHESGDDLVACVIGSNAPRWFSTDR